MLIWGMLFGAIGMGYIVYGKRQRHGMALLAGVALCFLPYVLPGVWLLIPSGALVLALPYYLRS